MGEGKGKGRVGVCVTFFFRGRGKGRGGVWKDKIWPRVGICGGDRDYGNISWYGMIDYDTIPVPCLEG